MFYRLFYTLQAEVARKDEARLHAATEEIGNKARALEDFHWQASEELIATIREEVIIKWKEIEPCPPYSGIGYTDVDIVIDPIEDLLPGIV